MFLLFFKIDPPAVERSWNDMLQELLRNPVLFAQKNLVWIVVILVMLFALSRLNNILEIKGVNRAIFISRAAVSTFTAFIIAPTAFILLVNLIAVVNKMPTIDLMRIWDWIYLTLTSYWWLLRCYFNSADIQIMSEMYDGNSIIRILWMIVPISFVWLRTAETNFWRLMLIPIILSVLFVTRYRAAQDTFLTEMLRPHFAEWFKDHTVIDARDPEAQKRIKDLEIQFPKTTGEIQSGKEITDGIGAFYKDNNYKINLFVAALFAMAILIGYVFKRPQSGTILAIAALMIFFVFDQGRAFGWHKSGKSGLARQQELDALFNKFVEAATLPKPDSVMMSVISMQINKRLAEEKLAPPDSLCVQYHDYFSEACANK